MLVRVVPSGPQRFAILCALGYVAASWALRFDTAEAPHNTSLTYPFDTYSMYSSAMSDAPARIVVRTSDGAFHSLRDFHSFRCDAPLDASHRCSEEEGESIHYIDDDMTRWVHDHAGDGDQRIEIVRRSWSLSDGAATTTCVLTRCTAAE